MNKFLIGGAVVVLAGLGFWQKDAIREKWETRGMTDVEKTDWELKDKGVIKADGKVEVDSEFDADLNGIDKDLKNADASDSDELGGLENEE